jgi:outer membrane protein assembly factor BamB
VAISSPTPSSSNSYVAIFRGNPARTGAYTGIGPKDFNKLIWKFETDGNVGSSPAVVDGVVYFGSYDGHLYAVDVKSGQEKWKFTSRNENDVASPAVVDGVVYFGSLDSFMYALNAQTGQKVWEYKTGNGVVSSPAVVDGVVYFGSNDSFLYALTAQTGQEKWKYFFGNAYEVWSSPAVIDGVVYIGSSDGLHALDVKNGQEVWRFVTRNAVNETPAVVDGVVYFGDIYEFYAVDVKTGQEIWKIESGGGKSSPAMAEGIVCFSCNDGLCAVDAKTGQEQWKFALSTDDVKGYEVWSSPAIVDGVVYFGSINMYSSMYPGMDNYLFAVDVKTGREMWKFAVATDALGFGVVSSPAVVDGVVYFGCDNNLYALK